MDQILSSLLASDQPDRVKRQIVQQIAGVGPKTEDPAVVMAIFNTTTGLILDAQVQLSADLCKKVYIKWAKYHRQPLCMFFDTDFIQHLLESKFQHPTNVVWLLHETFLLLRGTEHHAHLAKIVELKSINFVRDHPKDDVLTAFCKFLFEFKECIPKNEQTSTFCVAMVHAVSAFSAPTDGTQMTRFIFNVTSAIGSFMQHIWNNSAPECIMHCLKAIFSLISYVDQTGHEPCVALGGLMSHIPLDLMEKVVKMTVTDTSIADINMVAALLRTIDWLNWPVANNIDYWILAFLNELARDHKYTILIRVTELKIEQVFLTLEYRVVRERAMAVVSHMLLSFQHSPEVFHKVVQYVPQTVRIVAAEGGPESVVFLDQFSELLHCLMTLHPGFPELYEKVVDSIKDYKKPSAEEVHLRLTQSKWSFQQKPSDIIGFTTRFAKKSETEKTGLGNLGNTCYMNSVLQALFMCDGFRREVVRSPISPQQYLLIKLQYVFAHLALTQRAAYLPIEFLKASRPPWFTVGHQQDCSEFLRYLLDQLNEQELNVIQSRNRAKASNQSACPPVQSPNPHGEDCAAEKTLIRQTFGGQMRTTSRCLKCRKASSRTEDFTDIPLAFPNQGGCGAHTEGVGKAALAGGAMGGSPVTAGCGLDTGLTSFKLEDLVEYYLKPELLQGDNRYQCEACGGLQDAERSQVITRAPDVLLLTLLRFAYDIKTQSRSKIFTDVMCPKTIHIPVASVDFPAMEDTPGSRSSLRPPAMEHTSGSRSSLHMPATEHTLGSSLRMLPMEHTLGSRSSLHTPTTDHTLGSRSSLRTPSMDQIPGSSPCTPPMEHTPGSSPRTPAMEHTTGSSPRTPAMEHTTGSSLRTPAMEHTPGTSLRTPAMEHTPGTSLRTPAVWDHETYCLCSVVVHSGTSSECGHYYCYGRHASHTDTASGGDSGEDYLSDTWYLFNDSRITFSSYTSFSNVSKKFAKDTIYLLLYKRIPCGQLPADTTEPPLRKDLRDAVERDNKLFLQEQELEGRARALQRKASANAAAAASWRDQWKDGDGSGPPGGCGGGGGGGSGFGLSVARFSF